MIPYSYHTVIKDHSRVINDKYLVKMVQDLRELVKNGDKILIHEIKGIKVALKISWFDTRVQKIQRDSFL